MIVISSLRWISLFFLMISMNFNDVQGENHREKRQRSNQVNQNQQDLINNENTQPRGSSQFLAPSGQSKGFYNSPAFKPPTLSGGKPVGWFDTKYPNWISDLQSQMAANEKVEGKNGAPSSYQAGPMPRRRDDGGSFFLQKLAKQHMTRGEKAYNYGQLISNNRGTICSNFDNYGGFVFGRFPCPLPIATGMNQLDQFCCGPANSQYCCNADEFNYQRQQYTSADRYWKSGQYPPSSNRAVAIIVPIVSIFVLGAALALIFLYYRKTRNEQNRGNSSRLLRPDEKYSTVPQDPPVDNINVIENRSSNLNVQH